MASLGLGVSESTIAGDASEKSVSLKKEHKAFIGPPPPVHRDGMGRYKPKPGEKPLSSKDEPMPGPLDYLPNYAYVKTRYPEYTLRETCQIVPRTKRKHPAPCKYNLSRSFEWGRCKRITMKHKNPTTSTGGCGPGPGTYKVDTKGSLKGPSFSIRQKLNNGFMPGGISAGTVMPDPTFPGPNYRPDDEDWLKKPQTFGAISYPKLRRKAPGPATYRPKYGDNQGPKWAFGTRRRDDISTAGPGPTAYKAPQPPSGPKFTMRRKFNTLFNSRDAGPAPNHYFTGGFSLSEPGYTMQYRWFDSEPERLPGPNKYKGNIDAIKKREPAYTIKNPWPKYKGNGMPGPGDYDVCAVPWNKGVTMTGRPIAYGSITPSPAHYCPEKSVPSSMKRAPAYTLMGTRAKDDISDIPGPACYNVKDRKGTNQGKSMTFKHECRPTWQPPGPGQRTVGSGLPAKCEQYRGKSVSSRHTPNKYLGFRSLVSLKEPVKDAPSVPLFG